MKLLLVLSLLIPVPAFAQAAADKALVTKRAPQPRAPLAPKAAKDGQMDGLQKGVAREKRAADVTSKASRERHKSTPNAVRNER